MNCRHCDMSLFQDKKGFTLLEVLIAICLLTVGMMGLVSLQSRGIRGNDLGNRTTQAVALAQDQLEQLIDSGTGVNFPLPVPSPNPFSDLNNPVDETGNTGGIFTRSWTVSAVGSPVTDAQQVDVNVEWTDIIGLHSVNVSGVIAPDAY